MSIRIVDREFSSILLIDDDVAARQAAGYCVEDIELKPIQEDGPIIDMYDYLDSIEKKAQGVICDQKLKVHDYSRFNGAEIIGALYDRKFPAILCTRFENEDLDQIRNFRRKVPVLLKPDELNDDSLVKGLEICINEFNGNILPSRKPWKTMIRIENVDYDSNENNPFVYLVIPGWDPSEGIRIYLNDIPTNVRENVKEGERLYAQVNLGAENHEDLFIVGWNKLG